MVIEEKLNFWPRLVYIIFSLCLLTVITFIYLYFSYHVNPLGLGLVRIISTAPILFIPLLFKGSLRKKIFIGLTVFVFCFFLAIKLDFYSDFEGLFIFPYGLLLLGYIIASQFVFIHLESKPNFMPVFLTIILIIVISLALTFFLSNSFLKRFHNMENLLELECKGSKALGSDNPYDFLGPEEFRAHCNKFELVIRWEGTIKRCFEQVAVYEKNKSIGSFHDSAGCNSIIQLFPPRYYSGI